MARKKKNSPVRAKKTRSILFIRISTLAGTLMLLITAVPVVLLANYIQTAQKNVQMVEGISDVVTNGSAPSSGNGIVYPSAQQTTRTIPPGCYPIPCNIMCSTTNPNCCANRYYCPGGTPNPEPTCTPPPPCLTATPRCLPAVPSGGWCLPSPSLTPPVGCYYNKICTMNLKIPCYLGDLNCQSCRSILTCPSITPPIPSVSVPQPSCPPVPPCNSRLGIICKLPKPCMINNTPLVTASKQTSFHSTLSSGFSIIGLFNYFVHGFLSRPQ